jgi:hypothetical protein
LMSDSFFDPFAPVKKTTSSGPGVVSSAAPAAAAAAATTTTTPKAKNKQLFNPFLSSGAVESPKLMRRVMRSAGIAPPAEEKESDDENENESGEQWSDDDEANVSAKKAAHKQATEQRKKESVEESAKRRQSTQSAPVAVAPLTSQLSSSELLARWKRQQIEFIQAVAMHPDIVTVQFQRLVLKAGVFEACTGLLEDPTTERSALLFALGLLKRLTSKHGAITSVKFSHTILKRLCEEAKPECDDARIRAFAVTLLAAIDNKAQLDEFGFYEDCIKYCSPGQAPNSPLVENALAIALVNFSLDVARQRRILSTITMARLTAWAKSLEPDLKTCAAAFIGNLVANEDMTLSIIHDGGLTILLKLMAAPGAPSYKEHAARGLANLALHEEAHLPMLERGVLQILSRVVLEEPPSSTSTLRSALRCLGLMSVSERCGTVIAEYMSRSPEFAGRVNQLSVSDNEELAKHAEKAVTNIALHSKGKVFKKKKNADLVDQLLQRRPSLDDLGAWNVSKETQLANAPQTPAFSPLSKSNSAVTSSTDSLKSPRASGDSLQQKSPRNESPLSPRAAKSAADDEAESDEESRSGGGGDDDDGGDNHTTIRLDTGERRDSFGDLATRHKGKSSSSTRGAKSALSQSATEENDDELEDATAGLFGGEKKKSSRAGAVVQKLSRRTKPTHV